ncbi:MAG TPA: hypothetical protein P5514_13815 [Bacteroidales bacterium]|nr:hypothetical protein [Bacteroidales bacterium]HRX98020.1 hypothetical protein [Bacteroidales bacterium]
MRNLKSICIVEIDYHPEVLHNTCILLAEVPFEVTIFTTRLIFDQAQGSRFLKNFNWIIIERVSEIKQTFQRHLPEINSSDLILFNTLASHFKFFSKLEIKTISILRLHNSNAYLNPGKSFKTMFTPYFLFKDSSHIIRKTLFERDWYFRNKFLKRISYVVFPDPVLENYAVDNRLIDPSKVCPSIPISSWNPAYQKQNKTDEIRITIPGTIDIRRRDYRIVLNAFTMLSGRLNQNITLTLLGRPKNNYGKEIISEFRELQNKQLKVITFTQKIPMDEYNSNLQQTDFFILPIKIDTKYTIYRERYGYTKISGSINDMIIAGKPALINADYPINSRLEQISEKFYNEVDLHNTLINWVHEKTYLRLQEKISESLSFYSHENMKKYVIDVFTNLINNFR